MQLAPMACWQFAKDWKEHATGWQTKGASYIESAACGVQSRKPCKDHRALLKQNQAKEVDRPLILAAF